MKDLMKKMMKKQGADNTPGDADMKSEAKLKVLSHLRKMASDMMGEDVKKNYAHGGVVDTEGWAKRKDHNTKAAESDADLSGMSKPVNDGTAKSQGIDDGKGVKEASVAEHNSMDNEETAEDYNEEYTQESLDAEIARLTEMKRRVSQKD